jgi:hypothetical protein
LILFNKIEEFTPPSSPPPPTQRMAIPWLSRAVLMVHNHGFWRIKQLGLIYK